MAQLINERKGGLDIDGIIKEFQLNSEKVNAGEFVNYVNELNVEFDKQLLVQQYSCRFVRAVRLTDTKAFVISQTATLNSVSGMVISIENGEIKTGTRASIWNADRSVYNSCLEVLDSNHVVVTFGYDTSLTLSAAVCEINENLTFSTGKVLRIDTANTSSAQSAQILRVSANRVVILHTSNTEYNYINGVVCDINNNEITIATQDKTLVNVMNSSRFMRAINIDSNRYFVLYRTVYVNELNALVITLNGNTLEASEIVKIRDTPSNYIEAILLDENRVLIGYGHSEKEELRCRICEVNGTTISYGEETIMLETEKSARDLKFVKLADDEIAIFHMQDEVNYYLNCMICLIQDTVVSPLHDKTIEKDKQSSNQMAGVKLGETVLLIHSSDSTNIMLQAKLLSHKKEVLNITTKNIPYGVAMETKSQGQLIKVAIPKV